MLLNYCWLQRREQHVNMRRERETPPRRLQKIFVRIFLFRLRQTETHVFPSSVGILKLTSRPRATLAALPRSRPSSAALCLCAGPAAASVCDAVTLSQPTPPGTGTGRTGLCLSLLHFKIHQPAAPQRSLSLARSLSLSSGTHARVNTGAISCYLPPSFSSARARSRAHVPYGACEHHHGEFPWPRLPSSRRTRVVAGHSFASAIVSAGCPITLVPLLIGLFLGVVVLPLVVVAGGGRRRRRRRAARGAVGGLRGLEEPAGDQGPARRHGRRLLRARYVSDDRPPPA
jgi:hypothetical protein